MNIQLIQVEHQRVSEVDSTLKKVNQDTGSKVSPTFKE